MKKLLVSTFVLALVCLALIARSQMDEAALAQGNAVRFMIVDVAFDGPTLSINTDSPAVPRGTTFILNGKIFPGNSLPSGTASNSPDDPGSIGDFYCRGTLNFDLADILAGAPGSELEVVTTQFFQFNDGRGLTTEGLEGGVPTVRAITGGTDSFSGASGEMHVERIGTNATGDFNIRCTFKIKKTSISGS